MGLETCDKLLNFLKSVERGEIGLVPAKPRPMDFVYCEYEASNGWTLCIFNDCGEWDYIEWIKEGDGSEHTFDYLIKHCPHVADYRPSERAQKEIYLLGVGGDYYQGEQP